MESKLSRTGCWHTFLVLGRVSNLPTVWSNCLAAWLLAGGGSWERFATLCAAATLLYSGGMFLNDAFDAAFDRQYRPERPIPSGLVSRRAVGTWGAAMLGLGWLAGLALGPAAGAYGFGLLAAIVIYDAAHKRTPWAPLLMCACRFLLYLMAASAALGPAGAPVLWRALALAAYVAGLSCIARGESLPLAASRWPIALLLMPLALGLATTRRDAGLHLWLSAAALAAWLAWSLRHGFLRGPANFSRGVAGLLAGITLVDWLALGGRGGLVFVGLFLLALLLQRVAPAT